MRRTMSPGMDCQVGRASSIRAGTTLREQILARQIERGVVPKGTKLAPKPEAIPDWNALSDDEKRLFSRQAEVFAGFSGHDRL
jgi:arylsulfatase A-like enzyme